MACGTWPPQPGVQIVFPSGTIAGLATDYTVGRLTLRGLALGFWIGILARVAVMAVVNMPAGGYGGIC